MLRSIGKQSGKSVESAWVLVATGCIVAAGTQNNPSCWPGGVNVHSHLVHGSLGTCKSANQTASHLHHLHLRLPTTVPTWFQAKSHHGWISRCVSRKPCSRQWTVTSDRNSAKQMIKTGHSLVLKWNSVQPFLQGSVAEWLACWTQAQKGPGSNRSRDAVG